MAPRCHSLYRISEMVLEEMLIRIAFVLCAFVKSSGELLQEGGEPAIFQTAVAGGLE